MKQNINDIKKCCTMNVFILIVKYNFNNYV